MDEDILMDATKNPDKNKTCKKNKVEKKDKNSLRLALKKFNITEKDVLNSSIKDSTVTIVTVGGKKFIYNEELDKIPVIPNIVKKACAYVNVSEFDLFYNYKTNKYSYSMDNGTITLVTKNGHKMKVTL